MSNSDMTPNLQSIDHIHVFVQDRTAAEHWYSRVLGLHRVPKLAGWATNGGPLTIANSAGSIHLALFTGISQSSQSTIAFNVTGEQFLLWQSHLASVLGKNITAIDHELSWSLYFHDPDDNPYEITSYDYDWLSQKLNHSTQ